MARSFKSEYYELPTKYDKTVVKLLVQSPTRMFAYWDISSNYIKDFTQKNTKYEYCTPYLRITNLTMNYSYDIQISPFSNNYYIEIKDSDCDYKVEIIRKYQDKTYVITSSNQAHIPRSSPCEYNEDIVFRNCICLSVTDKFKIYTQKRNNLQKYTELSFGDYEDTYSSINNIRK